MPTKYLIAVTFFLLSCAGSAPRTFAQAAPTTPPRPPVFSPTRAAPHTVGQPGTVHPMPPRSPYMRELPQTPETRHEPGLWAGDAPQAADGPFVFPAVAGVPLPLPFAAKKAEDVRPTILCAGIMTQMIDHFELTVWVAKLSEGERACFVAELFRRCADFIAASKINELPSDDRVAMPLTQKAARMFTDEKCTKATWTKSVRDLHALLTARWMEAQ